MSESAPINISPADLAEDRFDRFRLIGWWDQARLARARVLVIGAGALGNEIIKNLALLGVGNVLIAELDRIEHSNLSRSVLYRASDIGRHKAVVAATMAQQLYPDIRVHAFVGDVIHQLGAGAFNWADVIIGGLDNREARLHINRIAWRLGKPWIDGAIEQIQGVARVFIPDPAQASPCYECTMGNRDWQLLNQRRSCALLTAAQMQTGKTPTTPTIASIIAGVQTQEAVKLLHNLESFPGRGWTYAGLTGESYLVEYPRKPDCLSHETLGQIESIGATSAQLTLADLLGHARRLLGPAARVELGRDIVRCFSCPACGKSQEVFKPVGSLRIGDALCPCDGKTQRHAELFHSIAGAEPFHDLSCAQAGVPAFDIVTAVTDHASIGLEIGGDRQDVLGPLSASVDERDSKHDTPPEGLTWL